MKKCGRIFWDRVREFVSGTLWCEGSWQERYCFEGAHGCPAEGRRGVPRPGRGRSPRQALPGACAGQGAFGLGGAMRKAAVVSPGFVTRVAVAEKAKK